MLSPWSSQPHLHPKKDGARTQLCEKATAGLESKFWAEYFEKQDLCSASQKEMVLEVSLDQEVKKKFVSTRAKPVLFFMRN